MRNSKSLFIFTGLFTLIIGFLDLMSRGLEMQGTAVTFSNKSVFMFIVEANIVFMCALVVGVQLLRRKNMAKWASVALALIYFSFLIIWLFQNSASLLAKQPNSYYLRTYAVLPGLVLLPLIQVVGSFILGRLKRPETEEVLITSPGVTPAEPDM